MTELTAMRVRKHGERYSVDNTSNPVLNFGQRKTMEFIEWIEGLFNEYYSEWVTPDENAEII